MLGLSLAIGIVVDDAIMVLENIVRYKERGMDKVEAARAGARQITFAAIATSMAIIAIFLPVAFMTGIIGKYFYEFGITISVAVAISLLEALTLTPMRCSQFLETGGRRTAFGKGIEQGFLRLTAYYRRSLERLLSHKGFVIAVAAVFFAGSLGLLSLIRKEFVPAQDQNMFFCRLQTPVGSSISFTDEKFKKVEEFIHSRPEVLRYFSAIGGFGGGEVNSGQIFVILKEPNDRPIAAPFKKRPGQKDLMAFFRKELNKIPDVRVVMQDPSLSGFSAQRGFPIEMTVVGPDWDKLVEYAGRMERRMKENDRLMTDVDTNYEEGVAEVRVYPDRPKASERGVVIDTVAETINALVAGERVAKYTQGGRRYDVRLRLLPSQRASAGDIESLWVWNNRGEMVQLKDVVTIKETPTALTITRRNRERAIRLYANVASGQSQADALKKVNEIVQEVLPEGYRVVYGGNTKTFQESFASLRFVLWLGVIVAYMVMASQFNSYKDPLIVLLALPFSVSGALLALWLLGQSLNLYSFIGVVLLMGIVKKNSILLVDFTNQLRVKGVSVREALLEACPNRLRAILMTSLSTIAAAIPPALALGPGAEVLRPMAITVIGGMIVSTFFTLLVIPCVYSLFIRGEAVPLNASTGMTAIRGAGVT
jgi:HAE1 family hydrophobic/amphiphilic exporter-1